MRRSRLERPRLTPQAPQACVSTNSTTPAECIKYTIIFYFFSQYPDCQILKKNYFINLGLSLHVCMCCLFTHQWTFFFAHAASFFLTLLLKNSEMFCFNLGLSLRVLFVYTPTNIFVCTCCEFFLTLSLKNSGMLCFNLGLSLHV